MSGAVLALAAFSASAIVPSDTSWAERMALSDMQRNPEPWQIDFRTTPKWNYTHGLMMTAYQRLYEETGDKRYADHIQDYADTMIDADGSIDTYKLSNYNIDHLTPGRMLLFLEQYSPKPRYQKALQTLTTQLEGQPRTSDGGFWHKKRYPHQMWLDGLYMGAPFYAQYLNRTGAEASAFDDVQHQFDLVMQHQIDPQTGLPYHAWDESREQKWADPESGVSPNFWSRSIGWYVMALVDAIEYFPEDHAGREVLSGYLQQVLDATLRYRDAESNLWYQVTDQGGREGNYLEATGSVMFVYAMAKGANRGYLPPRYRELAEQSFTGLVDQLVRIDADDHEVHLMKNCAVAGLGGNPYRDGSFEYYISEPVRDNDPKGVGPFILASLELEK
ncbi:glycoside hydrolase family 88/105 protein [Microbulbifer celer]|uniref:Glycoside hydrolase family 105 protein n=1 Tax=Microbulbifer celer TaxID=435905 RepID=A0ABW3UCV5_9GAMM|nr:glycoside hydrolase family 88 protein [Microbulbifer celer]UFN58142.1 glycoside hydrolase family 88 protein [Microbulbifer celer]